uniref:Chy1a n=1 Tax=Tomicus yunnanensis TaxID=768153 RepID=A0A6B8VCD4_9CUCU|nr:Chy1a [Tomicus yunnanensis]
MKIAIFAFVCFLSAFASGETLEELGYDWDNIKPNNIYVEPIGPAPVEEAGLRIVGGSVATRGAFPYQAALIINSSSFCGGSIISSIWVLTAAHCVDTATSVQIIVGAHNPRTTVNEPTQVRLAASARVLHSGWNSATLLNDVALLRAASIPISQSGISAISLAPASSGTFAGQNAIVSGWGRTTDASTAIANELRFVQVPVITNAVCQNSYGSSVQAQHICTSGAGGRGSCNGDSGGPLVIGSVEVGIVSFGARLCQAGHPSVYARVSSFRSWISSNSGV